MVITRISRMCNFVLQLLIILLGPQNGQAWLFTQGSCETSLTCHDCVVEYSLDQYNIRRPCTWCPATRTCEMMNQWTGKCAEGATYRDICPIATNLPRCITIEYSFWICERARPMNSNRCDRSFVDGFCSQRASERSLQICNGDSMTLETVGTVGFGEQDAFSIAKNTYGLEVNLCYVWLNAGAGEHRRQIVTTIESFVSEPVFLCNAQQSPDQATVVAYRVSTASSSGTSDQGTLACSLVCWGLATAVMSFIHMFLQE